MCCSSQSAERAEGHGSLGFMAPEAMVKNVPDPTKLDLWSLACVLTELRMGRAWFSGAWLQTYRDNR